MLVMSTLTSAAKRIRCMQFRQLFKPRCSELKSTIKVLVDACDDLKMSLRFKKVLKTILKVGNQMNTGGQQQKGFTMDSLLKLQGAKAFDNKTSILQYVITLVGRNDPDWLLFPDDLKNVAPAARIHIDSVLNVERTQIKNSLDASLIAVQQLIDAENKDAAGPPAGQSPTANMMSYLKGVSCLLFALSDRF